ncbi:hypothetical protein BHE74_00001924, partial [Ensete ventricosum]
KDAILTSCRVSSSIGHEKLITWQGRERKICARSSTAGLTEALDGRVKGDENGRGRDERAGFMAWRQGGGTERGES